MNTKALGAIIVVILLAGGSYWYVQNGAKTDMATNTQGSGKVVFTWKFTEAGEDPEAHAPLTKVSVTMGDKTYDVGTFQGTCSEIGASGGVDGTGLVEGELTGAQCWFAGGGDELGIFKEGNGFVVKHGELQEPSGEGGAFRGNFQTRITLGA